MKVAFHTLGCKLNFSETSTIARSFSDHDFERVSFDSYADVYVINTCSVTGNADRKCRKFVRQAQRRNSDAYIIVTGCYAQLKPDEIATMPGVDLVLGAGEKFRVFDYIKGFAKSDSCRVIAGNIGEHLEFDQAYSSHDRTRSFLKIQDGCDYKCSFCTIPLARGKSRSDTIEHVLENVANIAASGAKEIVLTGVNTGDYGSGTDYKFIDLIRALDEMEEISRFRISSIEPNLLTDEIIRFVAESRRFMPHFHVPLQSGSDEILMKMRRRYKRDLYLSRVDAIRRFIPDAAIGADIIVGFPGETERHFRETVDFILDNDISYLHVFTYSERDRTDAAGMEGTVPAKIREVRSKFLRELSERKLLDFERRFYGQIRPVLWESESQGGFRDGFTDNYIKVHKEKNSVTENSITQVLLQKEGSSAIMDGRRSIELLTQT